MLKVDISYGLNWSTSSCSSTRLVPDLVVNSSIPSAAHMHQFIKSALVHIMTCRLFGAKHYLIQCWVIVNWTCEMSVILFRGRWVKGPHKDLKPFFHETANTWRLLNMKVTGRTRFFRALGKCSPLLTWCNCGLSWILCTEPTLKNCLENYVLHHLYLTWKQ